MATAIPTTNDEPRSGAGSGHIGLVERVAGAG